MSGKADAKAPFWRIKTLAEMTEREWESLCDGCGKCCLIKLEDEDTGALHFTNVACRLLNLETCRCGNYAQRRDLVPDCVKVTAESAGPITGRSSRTPVSSARSSACLSLRKTPSPM